MTEEELGAVYENARQYLEKATNCIFCSSDKIEISSGPEFIMNSVFLTIFCRGCRSNFTEEYTLNAVHWHDEESVRKDEY